MGDESYRNNNNTNRTKIITAIILTLGTVLAAYIGGGIPVDGQPFGCSFQNVQIFYTCFGDVTLSQGTNEPVIVVTATPDPFSATQTAFAVTQTAFATQQTTIPTATLDPFSATQTAFAITQTAFATQFTAAPTSCCSPSTSQPTETSSPTFMPIHTATTIPTVTRIIITPTRNVTSHVCALGDLQQYETRTVAAYTIIIGDVEVNGQRQFDLSEQEAIQGYPESTIVFFEVEGEVYAPVGAAGCRANYTENDIVSFAQEQIELGCYDPNIGTIGCQAVRIVVVKANGIMDTSYYPE
jgi:hypothetical protein